METTRNKMPQYAKNFFEDLRNYLDTKLYFYGSIQRQDYFPEHSDIDVDIFTDNINSMIYKVLNFVDVEKTKIKRFAFKIKNNIVVGKKIVIKQPEHNFKAELSIFDEKDKNLMLYEHTRKNDLPFVVCYLVIALKFIYYQLGIISKDLYIKMKQILLNGFFDEGFSSNNFRPNFVSIDVP